MITGHTPNPDFGNEPGIFKKDYSWQERSLQLFQTRIDEFYATTPGGFERAWVDQVTPSGGKTIGSLKKAGWLIDQDLADYVVWVVPRNSIKGGFEDDAKLIELINVEKRRLGEPHLRIDVDLSSDRTKIPRNHHGGVITYQALESMYDYLVLLSRAGIRLAFVFDEIHHGVEEDGTTSGNQWGAAAKRCVEMAHCVICLTGTPLRSDDSRVPFLSYRPVNVETEDGMRSGFEVEPSFAFTYADGMAAGIARKLIFEHFDPWIDYVREDARTGEVIEQRQQRISTIAKTHAQRLKRTPFQRGKGDLPQQMLTRAMEACDLMRRKGDTDAAILVICSDARSGDTMEHASEVIHAISGEAPVCVGSDDPLSKEKIRRFKRGANRWIVAKQMISEGTNLPRVRVVVLLSSPTQRVYWYQLIHRATRNEADDRLQDALVLQMKIDPLDRWAAEVEQEVLLGIDKLPEQRAGAGVVGESEGPDEILRGLSAYLDEKSTMLEGEDYTSYDRPASLIYERLSPQTKQERWHILKTLHEGELLGVITLAEPKKEAASPFSVEERARRFWEEGVKAIRQAVAIYQERGAEANYGVLVNACKRAAGMGKQKVEDLLASHSDPLTVTQRFYEAARKLVGDAKRSGGGEEFRLRS